MQLFTSFLLVLFTTLSPLTVVEDSTEATNHYTQTAPKPLEFDEEKMDSLKQDPDLDYTEKIEKENWWTTFKRYLSLQWQRLMEWLFGDFDAPVALKYFLQVLPYLLLGLILYFIVYLFLKLNPAAPDLNFGKAPDLLLDEDEKIIRSRDIPGLIQKALAKNNYRLAIRYQFLFVLQQLSEKDLVIYDAAKTDEEYLAEIKDGQLKDQFKKVNRIYDFIWYGNFQTDQQNYLKIERDFQKIKSLLST